MYNSMFRIENGREHFYQWDVEQRLIIDDTTITEVHFCNKTEECALVVEVYTEGALRFANVPNILLQTDWSIRAYAYCNDCYTKQCATFKVMARSKPDDYVYTETEVKRWEDLEARVTEGLAQLSTTIDAVNEAELNRSDFEADRRLAETNRQEAEALRVMGEDDRKWREASREEAERAREEAEVKRQENFGKFANALKGSATGELVSIDDTSPVEHEMDIKVKNKNLINIDAMLSSNLTKDGDSYKLTRTASSQLSGYFYLSIPANTPITLSAELIEYTGTHSSWLRVEITYTNKTFDYMGLHKDESYPNHKQQTLTTKDEVKSIRFYIERTNEVGAYSKFKNVQIEVGSAATSYAPYIEDFNCILPEGVDDVALAETVKVIGIGKNFCNLSTITTASNKTQSVQLKAGKTYTISALISAGASSDGTTKPTGRLGFIYKINGTDTYSERGAWIEIGKVATHTAAIPAEATDIRVLFQLGGSVNSFTWDKIQVELGDAATEYEPYKAPFYYDIEPDNSVKNIMGKGEPITLYGTHNGIVIDCDYNRDINKAYQELYNAFLSLGGNV